MMIFSYCRLQKNIKLSLAFVYPFVGAPTIQLDPDYSVERSARPFRQHRSAKHIMLIEK